MAAYQYKEHKRFFISHILKMAIWMSKIPRYQLANLLNIDPNFIYHITKDIRKVKVDDPRIIKLAEHFKLSIDNCIQEETDTIQPIENKKENCFYNNDDENNI